MKVWGVLVCEMGEGEEVRCGIMWTGGKGVGSAGV